MTDTIESLKAELAAERVANAGLRAALVEARTGVEMSTRGVPCSIWLLNRINAALSAAPPLPMGALRAASVKANTLEQAREVIAGLYANGAAMAETIADLREEVKRLRKLNVDGVAAARAEQAGGDAAQDATSAPASTTRAAEPLYPGQNRWAASVPPAAAPQDGEDDRDPDESALDDDWDAQSEQAKR